MTEVKARTLNEKQQRQSLSGSKNAKAPNRSIRNVLAKPYEVFWPVVELQLEEELQVLLQSLLPAAKKVVTPENRKDLRKLQGKKMKEARTALCETIWENNQGSKELRSFLLLGVNDVARGLETNSIASVLISNEADPPIMTQHLSTLAVTKNVPHLVLQNLKVSTKKTLDFSCLAIGFKRIVAENEGNHFHPIHLKIEKEFRKLALKGVSEMNNPCAIADQYPTPPLETQPVSCKPQDLYLIRTSKSYRAFVPGQGVREGHGTGWSPYISLSGNNKDSKPKILPLRSHGILGSESVKSANSFLQKVREAKKSIIVSSPGTMETGSFLSFGSDSAVEEAKVTPIEEPVAQVKPVRRYFTSFEPLKIKRIQGNPKKVKKKPRGKMK